MKTFFFLTFLVLLCFVQAIEQVEEKPVNPDSAGFIFAEMRKAIGETDWIESIRTTGTITQPVEQGSLTFEIVIEATFPDKIRLFFQGDEYSVEKSKGWKKYPKGYFENLSDYMVSVIMGNLKRNLIYIASDSSEYSVGYLGNSDHMGKNCYLLELKDKSLELLLRIDQNTFLPCWMEYYKDESDPPEKVIKEYLEYSEREGIMYPVSTRSIDQRGNLISEVRISKIEFNIENP